MLHAEVEILEVAKLLANFQETIRITCQADVSGFGFITEDNKILLSGPTGRKTNSFFGLELPKNIGLGWLVVQKGTPKQLRDYISCNEIYHDNHVDMLVSREGIRSSLATPFYCGKDIKGVIYAWNHTNKEFTVKQVSEIGRLGEIISDNPLISSFLKDSKNYKYFKDLIWHIDIYTSNNNELIAYYEDIINSITEDNLSEKPLEKLASLLGRPVIFVDKKLRLKICIGYKNIKNKASNFSLSSSNHTPFDLIFLNDSYGNKWLAAPVKLSTEDLIGYVGVLMEHPIAYKEVKLLKTASMILAFLEKQEYTTWNTYQNLREKLVEQLLKGTWDSEEVLLSMAEKAGLDLNQSYELFIVSHQQSQNLDTLYKILKSEQFFNNEKIFISFIDNNLALILPKQDKEKVINIIKKLLYSFKNAQYKEGFVIVTSSCKDVRDYHLQYKEIQLLLNAFLPKVFRNEVISLEDIGPRRIFLKTENQSFIKKYVNDILGPLLEYDAKKGTELTYTLQCYFDNKFSRIKTAKKLFIHEHTLDYRLKKIQDLIKIDLNDSSKRFDIYFVLEALKIFQKADLI